MKRIIRGGEGVVVIPSEGDKIVKIYKDGDYFRRAATGAHTAKALLSLEGRANAGQNFAVWAGRPISKNSLSPNIAKKIEGFTHHVDGSYFASVSTKLGLSIDDITGNLAGLRDIPVTTLIGQMIKLLRQVELINRAGYVHGDIRPSNITCHPAGHLFLIDYGFFMPKVDFYSYYQEGFGFYSNPPEYLLNGIDPAVLGRIIAGGWSLPVGDPAKPICDELNTKRVKYAKDYGEDFPIKSALDDELRETLIAAATTPDLSATLAQLDTFDSFGLATTLLTILYWYNQPSNRLLDKLKTEILMPLANFSLPRATLANIWPNVEELNGAIGRAGGGRRSKTHRKRRRSTKKY